MGNRDCIVKVCGLKEKGNIEEVFSLAPDYCGLIFYEKSPRFVNSPDVLPDTIDQKLVGVFVDADCETILDLAVRYRLACLQLHGAEPRADLEFLKMKLPGVEIWKAIRIRDEFPSESVREYVGAVDSFLFDTYSEQGGGSGEKFSHALIEHYEESVPYLLSGGIGPEDVSLVKDLFARDERMRGVDINSRFEAAPGVKDVSLVNKFLIEIRRN